MSCIGDVADVQYHGAMSRWQVQLDSGEVFAAALPEADIDAEFRRRRARAARLARDVVPMPEPHELLSRRSVADRGLSTRLDVPYRRPTLYVPLLLIPPLLWFGTVYLGSLFTLLAQSIYSIDEFTAKIVYEPTLATYKQVVTQPANVDIILRTLIDGDCGDDRLRSRSRCRSRTTWFATRRRARGRCSTSASCCRCG